MVGLLKRSPLESKRVWALWLLFGGVFIQVLFACEYLTDFALMRRFVFPVLYVQSSEVYLAGLLWSVLFGFPVAYGMGILGCYYLEDRVYYLISQLGLVALVIAVIGGFYV